ncbi:hypothetical protein [Tepidibacter aestuarii]|uniref:hypothetical protein n=1 Tax=Tepidibacter aestuarii TaxID=2925782 RepID=UPI0020BE37A8|nr:hypothetical protein [Tepidibacter aestuarii]CAH2215081.1 exported protein of unknown function [Tepidibacter aestuarii]
MFNKLKQFIATLLTLIMLFVPTANVFANTYDVNPSNNEEVNIHLENIDEMEYIPQEFFDPNHPDAIKDPEVIAKFEKMLEKIEEDSKPRRSKRSISGGAAIIAVYEIPGIGEVALLATGAIIVGGALYKAGSWLYEKVANYLGTKTMREGKNWTHGGSEKEILEKVGGKRGTEKGDCEVNRRDGTRKYKVRGKKTNKHIGDIHYKQPVKGNPKQKEPPHYHDNANRLGKGSSHHWYWDY